MGLEDVQVFKAFGCLCCCFWTIFACASIGMSLRSLEQGKYAVELKWATQKISDVPVQEPGLKFVGLGNELLEYPSTFQTMYFTANTAGVQAKDKGLFKPVIRGPIRARSADGLEMYVTVSFQWKLKPSSLTDLYEILGETMYRDEFVRFARAAIIKTCSKYPADEYFTNRNNITNSMLDALAANFNASSKGLDADIKGLQLQEIDLPDKFDAEIANTQSAMQEVEVAEAERVEKVVSVNTELLVATQAVDELLEQARGSAESLRLSNEADVRQLLIFQEKQALANLEILKQFAGDEDPFGKLFEVMEIQSLDEHKTDNIMVDL
eukprot:TRINITY_DN42435_c0_g1_i1.p1 TRINITY_DN42435_c0_g1~~TRINITY_DN42435_c0_g1_i1.p1  ORF type:complete len:324 (+),score=67.28 TRINITY_DN42435_c0_g1_i1:220-1191(+)